jgi:hypothetical protein
VTDTEAVLPSIRPTLELFRPNAIALWATTYSIELELFNEFLLGRLGDPPLNIAILADPQRLSATLERIPPEKSDQVAAINQRWLLRGAHIGSGRFHPKSYLMVTPTKATLLVGSGNLSTSGLDEGREVFTEFESGTAVGDEAIAVWRTWMRRLVRRVDDTRLAERFADLEMKLPVSEGLRDVGETMLLHNLDEPLADQLVTAITARATPPVDELLVAAPFFDRNALALGRLIERLAPRNIYVYTTSTMSVDGPRLASMLDRAGANVSLYAYEPDVFTHAKLIGIVAGSQSWIFSGSANLSQAALTLTASAGNVELSVLTSATPEQTRDLFIPPGAIVRAIAMADLNGLAFAPSTEATALPVHLQRAAARPDGAVEVCCQPSLQSGWHLNDLHERSPLVPDGERVVTTGPLHGRLVFIVDDDGAVLSNRVVVDDPVGLDAVLQVRSRASGDRPPELLSGDLDTPVGKALLWLHRNLVMDVTERASPGAGSGGVGSNESDSAADDALWERLEHEKLGRDPRANTYERLLRRSTGLGASEPILELLEAMRDRVLPVDHTVGPGRSVLTVLREQAEREAAQDSDDDDAPIKRWKTETRIRVRARNVLRRWAAAQTDPRLVWIDQLAPAGNFAMLAGTFAKLWVTIGKNPAQCELRADDLDDLWLEWMRPFVGTGRGDGWLDQPEQSDSQVFNRLPVDLPEIVAALCWLALHNKSRETIIAWQPVMSAALSHGLLEPTDETARFVGHVKHLSLSRSTVESDLLRWIEFIDDVLWCERTRDQLGLEDLRLAEVTSGQAVSVRLMVRGLVDPLRDPRTSQLVVAVRGYRRCDGVAVHSTDAGWRLAIKTGSPLSYLLGDTSLPMLESDEVAAGVIEQMAATGGILADLFVRDQVA